MQSNGQKHIDAALNIEAPIIRFMHKPFDRSAQILRPVHYLHNPQAS
jgi:hypothetical protein